MSKFNVICLDDEETVSSLIKRLNNSTNRIHIDYKYPKPFPKQIEEIITWDRAHLLDGLVLDLRLDQTVAQGQEQADYRAGSLAQEIRTLATEGKLSAFPIFLWSIDKRLSKSFNKDMSSQELFDFTLLKEDFPEKASERAMQLAAIVQAYKDIGISIKKMKCFGDLLGLREQDSGALDPRVGESFLRQPRSFPIHSYAKYVLDQVVLISGPLIDELTLCARLGIDQEKSDDFHKLLEKLDAGCSYKGPFGDGWKRWWWPLVERWWERIQPNGKAMTSLAAPDRVDVLKARLKLKRLSVAEAIGAEYGQFFSTVCQVLKVPLDPLDGFVVAATGRLPWHDKEYISREAALNRAKYNVHLELDPFEKNRLESLKKHKVIK
jgi:hypothetical protein